MAGGWLASYIILWIIVVALALLFLSHGRLIGVIFERVGPPPARPMTDRLPDSFLEIYGVTLLDHPWSLKFPTNRLTLAVFVSPQCQTCNDLLPHLKEFFVVHSQSVGIVLLSTLRDFNMNHAYAKFGSVDPIPYIIADRFSEQNPVPVTPYAICLNPQGKILAKGVVNHYEHLLSLIPSHGAPT